MKRWFHIAFLSCIVAFLACNRPVETQNFASPPPADSALQAIDSLMWQRPDSAMAVLLDYFACRDVARNVSENSGDSAADVARHVSASCDRHYAHLLLAELLYKNDHGQNNRDDLLKAVAYFDSLTIATDTRGADTRGVSLHRTDRRDASHASATDAQTIAFLTARAHYINGVGYYERDSLVEACREYLKALEVMEGHFAEKELVGNRARFMALTYTHLSSLFSDLYLHEHAIYFGKLALAYYQKYDATPWHIAWMLNAIGAQYDMMDNYDSARMCYEEGIKSLPDSNNIIYRDLATHLTYLSYEKDHSIEATLLQLHNLIDSSTSEKESLSRHLTIGEVYFHENMFDSAWIHLEKVFHGIQSVASKKQAAEWLIEICKAQAREAEMMEYANFLVPFATQEENNSATKSQLTTLYNVFRQGVLDRQYQRIVRKNAQWTAVAICGLFFIILSIAWLYHKNKKKLQHIENQKPEKPANVQDRLLAFMEEPICQEIIQSVQGQNIKRMATPKAFPKLVLTDAQLQQLSMAANRHFAPIEILLEQHGQKAKPALVNLCHLYLLGMDEKQAAILLNRDYSSVKRYEKTLKTAFHTQENMVAFLRNTFVNT